MTSPFGPPHRKRRLATALVSAMCLLGCWVPPLFKEKGLSPYQVCTTGGLGGYGGMDDSQ